MPEAGSAPLECMASSTKASLCPSLSKSIMIGICLARLEGLSVVFISCDVVESLVKVLVCDRWRESRLYGKVSESSRARPSKGTDDCRSMLLRWLPFIGSANSPLLGREEGSATESASLSWSSKSYEFDLFLAASSPASSRAVVVLSASFISRSLAARHSFSKAFRSAWTTQSPYAFSRRSKSSIQASGTVSSLPSR